MPFEAMLITQEAIVKNCEKPAAQIAFMPPQVPARKRALQGILHQVVGGLAVTTQQRIGETAQSWDLRLDQSGLVRHRLTVRHTAGG